MALPDGASFRRYVIRSLLGSGGTGEVYLARDTRLDRDVALKLLPSQLANDADKLRRFELEARALIYGWIRRSSQFREDL